MKQEISWTLKPTTTVLVYREEVEQFEKLIDSGISIDVLIHLVFKKDDEILNELKNGKNFVDLFCQGQKKLYFKYLKILSLKLNLKEALSCIEQIEKNSSQELEKMIKKIAYPFFLLVFAFFMILFFSNYVLVQMNDYIENGSVFVLMKLLKYAFGLSIFGICLYSLVIYLVFYRFHKNWSYFGFSLLKKMLSLQFVCIFQSLEKTSISTQEILETMACMDFSIVGLIAQKIVDSLKKGETLETCFLQSRLLDADLKKIIRYALLSNKLCVFLDVYIKKCTLDLEKKLKKISTSIQLFSYISIGILVLVVYQIMMMPLNMLNQF